MPSFENPNLQKVEKHKEAYIRLEKIEYRDFTCEFLRVRHMRDTMDKYRKEIKDFIADSNVLVSESVEFTEEKSKLIWKASITKFA
jgi:hypothetical protein